MQKKVNYIIINYLFKIKIGSIADSMIIGLAIGNNYIIYHEIVFYYFN